MTFLELVQNLHYDSGATGMAPSSVVNQTGQARRLVNWIKDANADIQMNWFNWKFLRQVDERELTPDDNTLAAPSDFNDGFWDQKTFRIIPEGETLEQQLDAIEYEQVKGDLLDTSEGLPFRATIMPDGSLRFEGTPTAMDTFRADYYRGPDREELAANSDISSIPVRFHRVIVGRALQLYANYESAPEAKLQGDEIVDMWMPRLENSQLPNRDHARFRTGAELQMEVSERY